MRRTETPKPILIKFCMVVDIPDIITYTSFGDHRLRGFWMARGQISPSPIDFHRRPYNTLASVWLSHDCSVVCRPTRQYAASVRRILDRGPMPPCRLRRRTFWKFAYEMVHSEVYLNKYVVSIATFSTFSAFCLPLLLSKYNINTIMSSEIQKTALFCMFSLFNFSSIFPGGQLTQFAPMWGRPWQYACHSG